MTQFLARVLTVVVVLVVAGAAPLTAQEKPAAPTVAGTWNMALETPHGKMAMAFELKLDGKKVTGTISSDQMGSLPLTGEFVLGRLTFTVTADSGDLTFEAKFKDADTLVGNLSSHIGDLACTATRVKKR